MTMYVPQSFSPIPPINSPQFAVWLEQNLNMLLRYIYTRAETYSPVYIFEDADTTPSVENGWIFKTNNSAAKNITDFDDGVAGQIITIIGADSGKTTIKHNANYINLEGGTDFTPADNDVIQLIYDGTDWNEVCRSVNS